MLVILAYLLDVFLLEVRTHSCLVRVDESMYEYFCLLNDDFSKDGLQSLYSILLIVLKLYGFLYFVFLQVVEEISKQHEEIVLTISLLLHKQTIVINF